MRTLTILVAAAVLLCGCSANAARDPVPAATAPEAPATISMNSLENSRWRFVSVAGDPVPGDVTATLRLRDGRASGKAGCNSYGATYRIGPDGSASFTPGMSTKMACLAPAGAMRVEQGIFQAFRQVAKVETADGQLRLLDAQGRPLATLVPDVPQPRTP